MGLVAVVAMVVAGPTAKAGQWRITPSVSLQESFSDNVTGAVEGEEKSDLITTVSPGIGLRGSGKRVSLNFDYALNYLDYLNNNGSDEFRNSLTGQGQAEVWRDRLFINASASISQQIVNNQGAVSTSQFNDLSNRTEVRAFSLSPRFRQRFSDWAVAELNYSFGYVDTGSAGASNTSNSSIGLTITSGRRFNQFRWNISSGTGESGVASLAKNVNASGEYAVSRYVSLLASIGYEKISDTTLTNQPDGITWSGGFRLTPGPKTSVTVNYNERFNSQFVSLDASHRFGASTTVSMTYSESLETTQALLTQDLAFITTDADGNLIDSRTGLPFSENQSAFGLTDNTFRQRRFSANVQSGRRRNTYGLSAFREIRNTDATGVEETVMGGGINFSRRHSRKANSAISLNYTNTDFGTADGREDDLYSASANWNYRISQDFSASVSYSISKRNSSADNNDLTENVVTLRLQKTF